MAADAEPVTDAVDVASYDAVVLGSAVHGGRWLPSAVDFADLNTESLGVRPVWLFSVSSLGDEECMFPPRVARMLRELRREPAQIAQLTKRLDARAHRNFAGAIARSDWPPAGRAFFRAMRGRYGDHRNWPAVDAWADDIARALSAHEATRSEPAREPRQSR